MAIIVQPKTQAELNQLVSVLHSTGRPINFTKNIRVGAYFHTWEYVRHCNVHDHNVTGCAIIPVNELYAILNRV